LATSVKRTNEQWLHDLRSADRAQAIDDLRERLVRGLRYALKQRYRLTDPDLEDFAQEALVKILDNLETFRSESKFTTWAQKIAVRVAFSELRRKRWENISLQDLVPDDGRDEGGETSPLTWLPASTPSPERNITRQSLRAVLAQLIQEELTDLQRRAMVAVVFHEMPMEELARQMGTNRNALYKLMHDARQRLKERLEARGLTVEDVMAAFAAE
jgi:RNA polymerase sigma-70 factor (ECF subfamily)